MKLTRDKKIPTGARMKLMLVFAWLNGCNAVLRLLEKVLFRKQTEPGHILVFRTGSLGDNICALPSLLAIRKRYKNARIDILVNQGGSNLVSLEQLMDPSCYDEIINYLNLPRKEVVAILRKRKYDLVIQLPQTGSSFRRLLRDLFFFRLICKYGFGWRLSTVPFFRQVQEQYVLFPNETHRLALLLADYGIQVDEREYALNITKQDDEYVSVAFNEAVQNSRDCIAVVVGAKRPQNRWPVEYFNEVIQAYISKYNILLIGGPEDNAITNRLQRHENIFNFCGKLTPLQSAALIKRCKLVVSNDTGPMHLTYAVKTPVIAIFSSRDFPGKWFPPESPENIINRSYGIHCSLCLSENCSNNICMQQIKPSLIITQMNAMLPH